MEPVELRVDRGAADGEHATEPLARAGRLARDSADAVMADLGRQLAADQRVVAVIVGRSDELLILAHVDRILVHLVQYVAVIDANVGASRAA